LGLLLGACNHASKPSASGCCDSPEPVRTAETGSEARFAAQLGAAGSTTSGSPFRKEEGCARDFKATGAATGDMASIERLCAQGMAPLFPEPRATKPSPAGVLEVPFQVGSAACLRTAVVAGAGGLSISLLDPRGATLLSATSTEPLGVLPVDGTVCVRETGAYRAVVRLAAPSADPPSVTVQIWQATRD
jgi:hypothetical protein